MVTGASFVFISLNMILKFTPCTPHFSICCPDLSNRVTIGGHQLPIPVGTADISPFGRSLHVHTSDCPWASRGKKTEHFPAGMGWSGTVYVINMCHIDNRNILIIDNQ